MILGKVKLVNQKKILRQNSHVSCRVLAILRILYNLSDNDAYLCSTCVIILILKASHLNS